MEPAVSSKQIFRFGLFEADAAHTRLTRNGTRVKIQDQPFRVLILLLERPGQIVGRDELRDMLWPKGTFVDFDGSLNVILKKLRAVIDDDPDNPRFIETVPRRGYRFIAPVKCVKPESAVAALVLESNGTENQEHPSPDLRSHPALHPPPRRFGIYLRFALSAGVLVVLAAAVITLRDRNSKPGARESAPRASLAVIPFSNGGAGPTFDYLRFALASDVVTDLSYARSISVRPFASTTKYADDLLDPQAVGREMRVEYVISGDFVNEAGQLRVTAELTQVSDDTVLWRESVSLPQNEMVLLHAELAERLQNGILGRFSNTAEANEIPVPHRPRAYDMYLRSVAMPRDPEPNKTAIALLTEAIAEDPDYSPAWSELSWRYYLDAEYSGGGEKSYQLSEDATARATALDPNGTTNAIAQKTEHGNLEAAYDEAKGLLARRPDSSDAHFEMSYVYRYAGLLDRAAKECDLALTIDPGNFVFRSCSKVFMYQGNRARTQTFLDLDGNSGWSMRQEMQSALRQKDDPFALSLAIIATEGGYKDAEIVVSSLEHRPAAQKEKVAAREEADAMQEIDPEEKYEVAAMLSSAGDVKRAMRVLKAAIQTGYCAEPLLDTDPLLNPLRSRPDFQQMKVLAAQCQQNFVAHAGP